ncbi:hypothetical protein [Tannerella sp.]|uniref:hypothetical protein n=1 Tax=Tannerella sp. TaxID=2382127 RepID=UPI0026DBD521|nr:hypothetical protein [Tannerella sp.]MDO4703221.1 hypothetical protein [Tannerella sp.]
MVNYSETGFGAKLRKAQDVVHYIGQFDGYNPPRSEETIGGMNDLLNQIIAANAEVVHMQQLYKGSTTKRIQMYRDMDSSIMKLLPSISGAVEAQYGKDSIESNSIKALIKKMRVTGVAKSPKDPTAGPETKSISRSEQSFGSLIQNFNNIITILSELTGYNPSNTKLSVDSLKTLSQEATNLNNLVAKYISDLKTVKAKRLGLYNDLHDRVRRIKAYVKAQYGYSSEQYKMIKGIAV